jgi:hypothetical protein
MVRLRVMLVKQGTNVSPAEAVALYTTGGSSVTTKATTTTTKATTTTTTSTATGTGLAGAYAQCGGIGYTGQYHQKLLLRSLTCFQRSHNMH